MKNNTVIWVSLIAAASLAAPIAVYPANDSAKKGSWAISDSVGTADEAVVEPATGSAIGKVNDDQIQAADQLPETHAAEHIDKADLSEKDAQATPQVEKPKETPVSSENQENVGVAIDQEVVETQAKTLSEVGRETPPSDSTKNSPEEPLDSVNSSEESRATKRVLSNSLEQQFKQLRSVLETEDSFSPLLAENYFSYGKLLRDYGELDEAVEAYVNALHIQKINHGLYSPEQRPLLKELFETHYALGNEEEYEDYLERILWVESKNPDIKDDFSFHLLLNLGNQYLDSYLGNPNATTRKVETLLRAKGHLKAAVRRHKNKPLSVTFLPYGELALIGYLESRVFSDVDQTSSVADTRIRQLEELEGRELALRSYLEDSFGRGKGILSGYLKKATDEENGDHVVGALIALGDYHQLFRKTKSAVRFYKLAWKAAKQIPDSDSRLAQLSQPVALPSFDYAKTRVPIIPDRPSILVPVNITLYNDGRIKTVDRFEKDSEFIKHEVRARRAAKNLVFRPAVKDGELVDEQSLEYQIRIYTRKKAGAPDA